MYVAGMSAELHRIHAAHKARSVGERVRPAPGLLVEGTVGAAFMEGVRMAVDVIARRGVEMAKPLIPQLKLGGLNDGWLAESKEGEPVWGTYNQEGNVKESTSFEEDKPVV